MVKTVFMCDSKPTPWSSSLPKPLFTALSRALIAHRHTLPFVLFVPLFPPYPYCQRYAVRRQIPQTHVPSEVSTEPGLSFDGSSTFELCGTS